jgi:hypothetical protein
MVRGKVFWDIPWAVTKLVSRTKRFVPTVVLIVIGFIFLLAGAGVYLERTAVNSQLPMSPGLPADPDATIGIICMVLGFGIVISGALLLFLD